MSLRRRLGLCCAAWAALTSLALGSQAFAQTVQAIPELRTRITDTTNALSPAEKTSLEQLSSRIEIQRGTQIAVLLLASSAPEPIEDYSNRVANAWKIGRKGVGDGVLIVAALQDRKLRIEVARTLEGALPDATVKRMIREVLAPAFKLNQYAVGLEAALHRIDERLAAEQLPLPAAKASTNDALASLNFEGLVPFLVFGVVIGSLLRGAIGGFGPVASALGAGGLVWFSGYAVLVASILAALVVLGGFVLSSVQSAQRIAGGGRYRGGDSGYSSGGSWGGLGSGSSSSSSGGFSSGGGGDFSGGGASGDW